MTVTKTPKALTPELKEAYRKADRQELNKFDEPCQKCGEKNLFRSIEWAAQENILRKKNGEDPIIIKYCQACREKKRKQWADS
jgi:hypothetical protein